MIFNTWGGLRFQPIWRAAKAATPRIVERMDTDGIRSPHSEFVLYLYQFWSRIQDYRKGRWQRWLGPIVPLAHAALHSVRPSLLDRPFAEALSEFALVSVESPVATERVRRLVRRFGQSGENIACIPHPVEDSDLEEPGILARKDQVVSVGRWDSHQKNFGLMMNVLDEFLRFHPTWTACLPGPYSETAIRHFGHLQETGRIVLPGPLPNASVRRLLRESKVFLTTSRHEGFSVAVAEALVGGCSLAGPPQLAGLSWCCGSDSGTVATLYSLNGVLDALSAEAEAWRSGLRNPEAISKTWLGRVGATAVVRALISRLEKIPA